jgi:hypothetical protein
MVGLEHQHCRLPGRDGAIALVPFELRRRLGVHADCRDIGTQVGMGRAELTGERQLALSRVGQVHVGHQPGRAAPDPGQDRLLSRPGGLRIGPGKQRPRRRKLPQVPVHTREGDEDVGLELGLRCRLVPSMTRPPSTICFIVIERLPTWVSNARWKVSTASERSDSRTATSRS